MPPGAAQDDARSRSSESGRVTFMQSPAVDGAPILPGLPQLTGVGRYPDALTSRFTPFRRPAAWPGPFPMLLVNSRARVTSAFETRLWS